ncbi:putative outer wedge baseplate protein and lysozyme protein [Rhizobium phage RHph_I1_18]|nr:putative outer wedge baseplate protein and lysozyme protein [Rhizobium phage RHph_I1_18]
MADILYSDIPINLSLHPVTGDLARVTNVAAIIQSVKNIVLTDKYERPYAAERGSGVYSTLFDNAVSDTEELISIRIKKAIENDEKRATKVKVVVVGDFDRNSYNCTITFTPINTLDPVNLNVILNRVR